jgi:hypothetical protein
MNIILEHKEQIQINTVSDDKPVLCCCIGTQETPFVNEYEIDRYIDRYFLLYVPDTLSISENHRKVYQLIHELMMEENELTRFEREQKADQSQNKSELLSARLGSIESHSEHASVNTKKPRRGIVRKMTRV